MIVHDSVGIVQGEGHPENGRKPIPVLLLIFHKKDPPFPDDPDNLANFHKKVVKIPAAKQLLIDLRDAVDWHLQDAPH